MYLYWHSYPLKMEDIVQGESTARADQYMACAGESEGLARLKSVLSGVLQQGSSMLNSSSSSLAANFSQQVSPWLAMGCLSPRRMYQEVSSMPHHIIQKQIWNTCLLQMLPCRDALQ